ncbi:Putative polyamine transporter [Komagataella phaffii CBS 7435]|uniref:Protein involved in excretion of putrescine and spermidine n=2 Tax=Komagataella phaffii TaxID=460519 RepID=C4R2V2_KOMPG|nr:Protein involved in excretion of putrescine and spermidine [Komagataella phaffii GS115]AOA61969.1 GQ67_01245T0 [Komagataella phaffii]CAH2447617.1 Putative polyamine transporter [Komagataella phaffii CBS 7435]AOA67409.1 GQ68_00145T0 [Komagataella phaffii GS115]CAY69826.1 Protein involved in excretion of putrescine and spermidine [Komagataella phaffii GS115]CCA37803.1 Putative polyamine transporter [Komagataella phaffii CBS 7435]
MSEQSRNPLRFLTTGGVQTQFHRLQDAAASSHLLERAQETLNPTNLMDVAHQTPGHILDMITGEDQEDDTEDIERFNYKQELQRKLTVTSIIGLGFSLMGVPFGMSTTLYIGLIDGGSVTLLWGWVVVAILSLCTALSLAEICSKYPSSGGIYHQAAILASEKYSLICSWFTGWFLIIGNWSMFTSIVYGGAQFILSIFGLKDSGYRQDSFLVLLLFFIMVLLSGLVNLKFANRLDTINNLCVIWTIGTVLIIDIILLIKARSRNDINFVLSNFDASRSGWPPVIAFFVGLQPAAFTLQGFGMIPAMTDEVKKPEKNIPKGMVLAVLVAGITGVIFIIPILTILPELNLLLDKNPDIMPIDLVFKLATESYLISFLLVLLLVGAVCFAGIGSLTTSSRATYAFARDNALPCNWIWVQVKIIDETTVPANALFLSMGVACFLGVLSLFSTSAFSAFMGSAVISLSIANGIPILSSVLGKRKKVKGTAFKLKRIGYVLNIISLFWIVLTVVILCMPVQIPITIISMNYAFVVFLSFTVFAAVSWIFYGKDHFQGPQLDHHHSAEQNIQMHSLSNDNTKDLDDFSEHKDETIYEASNIDSNEGSTSFAMSTSKVSSPNSSFPDEADLDVLQDEDDGNPENSILGWDLLDDVRPTKLNRVFKGGSG